MAKREYPSGALMKGKRGLIMGVANKNSIAWAIAEQLAAQGAEIAFTYQGEAMERRVRPLAESLGAKIIMSCDVTDDASMDALFGSIEKEWGAMDFLVHSVAFAGRDQLEGSFIDNTTRDGFKSALDISAYSFVDAGRRASRLMTEGGSMVTMTYLGSERVVPNYNVMGGCQSGAGSLHPVYGRRPRPARHSRQRYFCRPYKNAGSRWYWLWSSHVQVQQSHRRHARSH